MNESRPKEFIAIPMVSLLLGAMFLALGAAAVGVWAWLVAGALILFGIAYGLRTYRRSGLDLSHEVPDAAGRRDSTTYNVLVVAEARCPADELHRIVQLEDLRQERCRHVGDATNRLPTHAAGHAKP